MNGGMHFIRVDNVCFNVQVCGAHSFLIRVISITFMLKPLTNNGKVIFNHLQLSASGMGVELKASDSGKMSNYSRMAVIFLS